jgi:hypothetical protein
MADRLLHVIATTDEGTERALKAAGHFAREGGTRVVVLVPHVVSFTSRMGLSSADPAAIAAPYRALVSATGVDATVRVCLCREPQQVFGHLLMDQAEVVVGGTRRRWWPSREERLARELASQGHRVTFADVEGISSEGAS